MNWEADTADAVARRLLEEFGPFQRLVEVRVGTTVLVRGADSNARRVTVMSPRHEELHFDTVVLAVGFGLETAVAPQALRSYWRDDALHQPEIEERIGGRTRYLVSGNGDGGLIDVLRLRLSEFRHETLLAEMMASADLTSLSEDLLNIENEAKSEVAGQRNPDRALYEGYRNLRHIPPTLDAHISNRLRHDTHVVFNYSNWPLSPRSSIFHRLLVSRLLAIDTSLEPLPGRLVSVNGHEPKLECIVDTDSGPIQRAFHRVVVRHGPRSALGDAYPSLHSRFEPDLRARNALDATRSPAWPRGFFDELPSAGSPDGTPAAPSPATGGGADPNGATTPDAPRVAAPESTQTVGPEARQLRDMLLAGDVAALERKLDLLSEGDRRFVLRSVTERALENEDAVRGFRRLVAPDATDKLDANVVRTAVTELLRRAAFAQSIPRKVRTLELPTGVLQQAADPVLMAFFEDSFDIVNRDQFDEVNAIVPALTLAQAAIPATLYERYFQTLVDQARSSSYQGAPAARRALTMLPDDAARVAMKQLNAELLGSHSKMEVLRSFIEGHRKLVPPDKEELVKDFLELSHLDFLERHAKIG